MKKNSIGLQELAEFINDVAYGDNRSQEINWSDSALYIVSGISGSGKTTLAKKMQEKLKCEIFSLDTYKEQVYEEYGFKNDIERMILWNMAKNEFQAETITLARTKKSVIVEYPFDVSWQKFFNYLSETYNYTLVIVNCTKRSFDDIWKSRIERDSNKELRPLCLTAKAYIRNELYENNCKINDNYKVNKALEYMMGKYTSLDGDYVITDFEMMKFLSSQI